ncbi:hypothetical protein M231_02914 [Tremella mesenterica]|uniref:Uncharacterized protein n=1 Tax=Tremella mesenterica TaxID=5217 RepID=A0A4Q1BPA3_TREME|nr:hypothetical protein M231_02914 [Tremella mesenterica]
MAEEPVLEQATRSTVLYNFNQQVGAGENIDAASCGTSGRKAWLPLKPNKPNRHSLGPMNHLCPSCSALLFHAEQSLCYNPVTLQPICHHRLLRQARNTYNTLRHPGHAPFDLLLRKSLHPSNFTTLVSLLSPWQHPDITAHRCGTVRAMVAPLQHGMHHTGEPWCHLDVTTGQADTHGITMGRADTTEHHPGSGWRHYGSGWGDAARRSDTTPVGQMKDI